MGDIIISVRKLVDAEESFFGWPKRSRRQQGRGRGIGGGVDPTKRGMIISASSKGGPRRRRLSVFQGNERGTRREEEMEGGGNSTKWGGGGWGDNNDYNGEYHCRHPPYSYSSRI